MKKMHTIITGSVLAAGVAASLFGAGSASAAPGAEVSVGGHQVGIGDRSARRRSGALDARQRGGGSERDSVPHGPTPTAPARATSLSLLIPAPIPAPTVHPPTSAPTSTRAGTTTSLSRLR